MNTNPLNRHPAIEPENNFSGGNSEHPTSNAELPTPDQRVRPALGVRCWKLEVGCFDCGFRFDPFWRKAGFAGWLMLLGGGPIRAGPAVTNSLADLTLEDLVNLKVTSVSKREVNLNDAAAAIFVLSNDDLRRSGATSIPEALRLVPGLDVGAVNSREWAVSARGAAPAGAVVFADPRHQAVLRSAHDFKRASLDAQLRYVNQSGAVSSYVTADVRLSYRPTAKLEFALVGQNLLEDRHQEATALFGTTNAEVPRGF